MQKVYKYLLLLALCCQGTACNWDINTDPNAASSSNIVLTLPAGIAGVGFVFGGQWQILGGLWGQNWTQSPDAQQYRDQDTYFVTPSDYNRQWATIYAGADRGSADLDGSGVLKDLEFVRREAEAVEDWSHFLVATAMKTYCAQMMADLYDDIPFTQALQGTANRTPAYDLGPDAYDAFTLELIDALDNDLTLKVPGTLLGPEPVGSEDLVFGGDMGNWVRFSNSLLLKIFLRQVNARPEVTQAGIETLFEQNADFMTNTSAFINPFADANDQRNPLHATEVVFSGNVNLVASNTTLLYLIDNGDPRIEALYSPSVNGNAFVGLPQGNLNTDLDVNNDSRNDYARPIFSATSPVYFMTQAEALFLLAEAAVRYPAETGLDAKALYDQAVTAAFDRLGLTGQAAPFIAPGGVYEFPAAGTDEEKIEAIITQKWVELNGIGGTESFYEFNRTGYPDFFTISVNTEIGQNFPQRLPFDNDEGNRNPNAPEGVREQITEPVWWSLLANP